MRLEVDHRTVVVFDLDDTLFKEQEFARSAFRFVSRAVRRHTGHDVYELLWSEFLAHKPALSLLKENYSIPQDLAQLLAMYRFHFPRIQLEPGVLRALRDLKLHQVKLGLVTDGRSVTQRNKLLALGVDEFFDSIVISEEFGSEKPATENFAHFELDDEITRLVYIGDNFQKDFVTPNCRGWKTIAIRDDGRNVHRQSGDVPDEYRPQYQIDSFQDLEIVRATGP